MNHPSTLQLREFLDGSIPASEAGTILHHVKSCNECQTHLQHLRQFDKQVQRALHVRAPKGMTNIVMARLSIEDDPAFAWSFFKNLAPVLALGIIASIVLAIFKITGKLNTPEIQNSINIGQSMYGKAGS